MARAGKYVLTGELGRGENAVVSSALDPVIGRPVAVKVMDKSHVQQLQRQAQAAGSLHHSNIIALYDYGEDGDTAWIAMELVQGKTLRQHLAGGYQPAADALPESIVQLLEALDYAHGRGVIHGALTADNVLINQAGALKLGGFGNAGDEAADVAAATAMVREVLGAGAKAADVLAAGHASARALLEALREAYKPRSVANNLGALRRAIKTSAETASLASKRKLPAVLFVDDEERVLNALKSLFDGTYEVTTASSGAAALALMKTKRFLVLVSDQRMPEMTGVELLGKSRSVAPATVRLLLTGYSDLAAIVGSVNDGEVFRFVSKPWQQEELRATLDEAVEVAIALEAAEARGRPARRSTAAVLVLGESEVARAARELSAGAYTVLEAAGAGAALELLAAQEVGALVCGLERRSEDPAALLRVLKEQSPQTQLIVVSEESDSELVIGLINEARIHRFLGKPLNLSLLRQAVGSALERYASVMTTPALACVEGAKRGRDSAQARGFLERIKTLGGRFARAIGGAAD